MQVAAEAGWTEGAPENMLGFLDVSIDSKVIRIFLFSLFQNFVIL